MGNETMKLWGVSVSYFTGKIEAYLRYKRIPYAMEHPFADARRIRALAGAVQVPLIERADGRWMSDSTAIIQAFEGEFPYRPVLPPDPVVGFIARLIEDYADEWLWRAAMHFRWSYEHDRELLSRILADEVTLHLPAPRVLRRTMMKRRQRQSFVVNDGVDESTRPHVEGGYLAALDAMSAMLAARPFLLGTAPSIADYGMMGPMFRHFGQDPTPAEIMRSRAPAVFEWVARMWNAGSLNESPAFLDRVPEDAEPLLRELAETHLVQLRENALAFARGEATFAMTVQGTRYRRLPVSQFRVHCLAQLREHFAALAQQAQTAVRGLLPYPGCDLLWSDEVPARSGYDEAREAPYNKAIRVFETHREPIMTRLLGAVNRRR